MLDIKTVYGFIMLGFALVTAVLTKKLGIDGDIQNYIDTIIAAALFLIAGIEINKQSKPPVTP